MIVHNYNPNIQDEAEAGGCCMSKASLYHIVRLYQASQDYNQPSSRKKKKWNFCLFTFKYNNNKKNSF